MAQISLKGFYCSLRKQSAFHECRNSILRAIMSVQSGGILPLMGKTKTRFCRFYMYIQ